MMRGMGFKGPSWEFVPVVNRIFKRQEQEGVNYLNVKNGGCCFNSKVL